jgi:hypothetical protein
MKYFIEWVWYEDVSGARWVSHTTGWLTLDAENTMRAGTSPYGARFWRDLYMWDPSQRVYTRERLPPMGGA